MKKRLQARDNARSVFGFGVGHVTWFVLALILEFKSINHKQDRKSNSRALLQGPCMYFTYRRHFAPKKKSPAARKCRFKTILVLFLGN